MTSAQRNLLGVAIVAAAVIIAWLTWAWSPGADTGSAAPAPDDGEQALADPQPTAAGSTPLQPQQPKLVQPTAAAPEPAETSEPPEPPETKPERIPTPHPMSLEQWRPPQAYGPLAEYKQRYDGESRGPDSSANEKKYRKLLDVPNIPPALLSDVSCRRSMCKLTLSWRPERQIGYAVIVESSKHLYEKRVAVEPGDREDDGSYLTNVYVRLTP